MTVPFESTCAFLDALLRGEPPTGEELSAFLGSRVCREDEHLEFKVADILKQSSRAAVLREYIAGFANALGGVLAIGIDDGHGGGDDEQGALVPPSLAPIETRHAKKVGSKLYEWATRSLASLNGYLGVPPRIYEVGVEGGSVLLVATDRAPSLVPVNVSGEPVFFFRMGESTLPAPAYLVADLVLGRRQAPTFRLRRVACRIRRKDLVGRHINKELGLDIRGEFPGVMISNLEVTVENDSLVAAKDVASSVLVWDFAAENLVPHNRMAEDLRRRLDIDDSGESDLPAHRLRRIGLSWKARPQEGVRGDARFVTLRPFDEWVTRMPEGTWWYVPPEPPSAQPRAALLLLAEGCEPVWFELALPALDDAVFRHVHPTGTIVELPFRHVVGARPRVALRPPPAPADKP